VSGLPIRVRLTAAFALAMVVVLAAAGVFVYLRLESDLDDNLDAGLETRATAVLAAGSASSGAPEESEEGFAQLLAPDGAVIDSAGGLSQDALTPAEREQAAAGERVLVERRLDGVEETARVLARAGPDGRVVAVGQTLEDRDETLSGVVASFAIGGPIAVALASLVGYALASAGLRPVEAMRRRAREVSLAGGDELLPLPETRDEIRRLGETLNEMLERLRRSFERERRFVADAGHELRTPLAVVKTELEGALRAGPHDPSVRDALLAAVEECDHLVQLAEDLLVVARAGEGGLRVQPEPLDVGGLFEGTAQRFGDRARERGRRIRVDVANGQRVHADELRLRQVLGNLVDNALRYGDGDVLLRAREVGGGVEIEVSDEGEGFEPELAERAFERFARGDGARTRPGTGLGLSIVRAIADAHGGRAELVPGRGGAVRIWLPNAGSGASQLSDVASGSNQVEPIRGGKSDG
jgi:two-component system OmpR family sensor kinase